MDKNFLEFWGNYLIAVARGQSQLEDLTRWIGRGFDGAENLSAQFSKIYGLEIGSPDDPSYSENWEKAAEAFRQSFREFSEQTGWIPKSDYTALEEENRALKDKITDLESTIARLRDLLDKPGVDQSLALKVFQDLIDKQGAEFQKLMQNLSADEKDPR